MKKLRNLRAFVEACVPELKANPDRLLAFVQKGSINDRARGDGLSHEQQYTAVLVITDWEDDPDKVFVPIIAWLKSYQPDRSAEEAFRYEAEILSNSAVDLEIQIDLVETVIVSDVDENKVTTHLGEILPAEPLGEDNAALDEWQRGNL